MTKPTVSNYARTLGAYGALFTAYFGGLSLWALGGSKNEGRNFSLSLFADITSAMIRLKLDVRGEENIWKRRPAVFIINHQSNADGIVTYKLLRRDVRTMGKKELRDTPILGSIYDFMGMIPVDRGKVSDPRALSQPLVDAIVNEGISVCIAPEGTRSYQAMPGPFKKGAFHLAMQAGVPVVPIVIHNAFDALPKGEFAYRPATVRVDVLEPIDTDDWTAQAIDKHVDEVRRLYLETLGLAEANSPAKRRVRKRRQ